MAPGIIDIQERRPLNLASDLTKRSSCDTLPPDPEIKYLIKKDIRYTSICANQKMYHRYKIFGERMHETSPI